MLYEGNLKLSHEKGKMNYGSPWNLVDVGDIMRNIYYKCDYVKEMLAPNGLLWLNFFWGCSMHRCCPLAKSQDFLKLFAYY